MNRSRWLILGVCVAGWILLAWSVNWFTQKLAAEGGKEPSRLAYAPADDMPPAVDLASIQRAWPDTLAEPGQSRRLRAYLHDTAGTAPPPAASPGPAAAPTPEPDLNTLLASADPNAGKAKAQACKSCHSFDAGAPNGIGPNLWQVVGRDIASRPGYAYSTAMTAHQGSWTNELLYDFLAHPAKTIPGTKMSFAGLRRPEDRAAVIRYLDTLGGSTAAASAPAKGAAR